jgi:hypothetical protein
MTSECPLSINDKSIEEIIKEFYLASVGFKDEYIKHIPELVYNLDTWTDQYETRAEAEQPKTRRKFVTTKEQTVAANTVEETPKIKFMCKSVTLLVKKLFTLTQDVKLILNELIREVLKQRAEIVVVPDTMVPMTRNNVLQLFRNSPNLSLLSLLINFYSESALNDDVIYATQCDKFKPKILRLLTETSVKQHSINMYNEIINCSLACFLTDVANKIAMYKVFNYKTPITSDYIIASLMSKSLCLPPEQLSQLQYVIGNIRNTVSQRAKESKVEKQFAIAEAKKRAAITQITDMTYRETVESEEDS